MKHLKAMVAGAVAAVVAVAVVWLLAGVALTVYIDRIGAALVEERVRQTGGLGLPEIVGWLFWAAVASAAVSGYCAGLGLTIRRAR